MLLPKYWNHITPGTNQFIKLGYILVLFLFVFVYCSVSPLRADILLVHSLPHALCLKWVTKTLRIVDTLLNDECANK